MGIKRITNYKGRFCAELENGKFVLNDGSMHLILCEKVAEGMKVLDYGIMSGKMMRTEEDFKWCVENMSER
jgi:hypothetical protein